MREFFQMYTKDHGLVHFQVIQGWIGEERGEGWKKKEREETALPRLVLHGHLPKTGNTLPHGRVCSQTQLCELPCTCKRPVMLAVWWQQISHCWFMAFLLSSNFEFIRTSYSTYKADTATYCIPHIIPERMSLCEMLFYSFSIRAWMISCASSI